MLKNIGKALGKIRAALAKEAKAKAKSEAKDK